MVEEKYKIITKYKFWGWTWEGNPPDDFEKGLWMITVILTFPFWIWIYLVYLLIGVIGRLDGKPKQLKVKRKIEEEEQTYY